MIFTSLLISKVGMACNISFFSFFCLLLFFKYYSGKAKVCCLYPNKNATSKSVQDAFSSELSTKLDCTQQTVPFFWNSVVNVPFLIKLTVSLNLVSYYYLVLNWWKYRLHRRRNLTYQNSQIISPIWCTSSCAHGLNIWLFLVHNIATMFDLYG